jgi:hypothetical protein
MDLVGADHLTALAEALPEVETDTAVVDDIKNCYSA